MATATRSLSPSGVAYQPRPRAVADRSLDRALRNAARELRAACRQQLDPSTSRQFTDSQRGRPLGTLGLARLLDGACRAGAPLAAALQLVRALEGHVRSLWLEPSADCPRAALQHETATQGMADLAQLQSVLTMSAADLERAVEATAAQITASQQLLASLTRELGRRRA